MSGLIVKTLYGEVQGTVEKSSEGFEFYAFKGIPYAEPPKGELRFKDPVSIKKWVGVRSATEFAAIAAQYDVLSREFSDNEDCLYLNVYTKSVNNPKAVMVWIHGGGFYFGCSTDDYYGPDYLIAKDVVLVTVSYRLGVFGFLNLEDEIAPGNQGLKDQVLALRWVKDNICAFGGDANNITIFGESAGGAAVHYLSLSPLAKGLFHKAISQSGITFNPWARIRNQKENAQKLCSILGKNLTDPQKIVNFLRTVSAKTLCESQEKLRIQLNDLPFGPGIDNSSRSPFMPIPIEIAAEQGVHVPYLVGHNSREGIFFLLVISKKDAFALMDQHFEMALAFGSRRITDSYNVTPSQLKRLYYKSEKISENNTEKYVDLVSDLFFIEGIHKFIKIQIQKSSAATYMYNFSYDPGYSLMKALVKVNFPGTCHFDEIGYIFKMRLLEKLGIPYIQKGTQEYRTMQQMTEMWTNFAKYGKPTVEISELISLHWQPVHNSTVLRCLNIDEDLTMQSILNIEEKILSAKDI